ncbi:unnamed protein product [Closterium sp. Naga37s-1]|nr:unnamed protein product [Closterium sp. Naga37s-1]
MLGYYPLRVLLHFPPYHTLSPSLYSFALLAFPRPSSPEGAKNARCWGTTLGFCPHHLSCLRFFPSQHACLSSPSSPEGAKNALSIAGTMLGYYPLRVLPSKTAILPVNPTYLPKSQEEREMCARTVYCTNIDKKVTQADVKLFFESLCGEISRLRLLGDYHHSTRIAFVEFVMAESAMAALNCSGAILGSLPIRSVPHLSAPLCTNLHHSALLHSTAPSD